jgi:phosphoenolpyruvate-protein kinase (PTS system EI component)
MREVMVIGVATESAENFSYGLVAQSLEIPAVVGLKNNLFRQSRNACYWTGTGKIMFESFRETIEN